MGPRPVRRKEVDLHHHSPRHRHAAHSPPVPRAHTGGSCGAGGQSRSASRSTAVTYSSATSDSNGTARTGLRRGAGSELAGGPGEEATRRLVAGEEK